MKPRRGKPWTGGGVVSKANPKALQLGSIVWAPIVPDGGVTKERRAVVIVEPSKDPNAPVWVIGVTSDGGRYDPADTKRYDPRVFVPMPHAADGSHPSTFTIPCAAKVTWIQQFRRSSIRPTTGLLSGADLRRLLEAINAAANQQNSPTSEK